MDLQNLTTEVLIIGAGLAGLSAAVEAAGSGKKVSIVCKGKVGRSGNTVITQNNMAVVWDSLVYDDSVQRHIDDTMQGGGNLNDRDLVEVLATEAADGVAWLIKQGVQFQKDNMDLLVKGSPGHSRLRTVRVVGVSKSNRTMGLGLSIPLRDKAKELGVEFLENILIISLLVENGIVSGAVGLDQKAERIWIINSGAVVLAGGGAGGLFQLSTNTRDVCGDSYALGYQAGAKIRDMEFIQFHPTVTVSSPKVLSTSPLADGAVLRNRLGDAYMARYSPRANMATRDVMARANFKEIAEGRGSERGGVFVDFSAVPLEVMSKNYPDILSELKGESMIEVGPAQHFMNGGIAIDPHCESTVPGLWVCGEAAGGVHGANRLAGNALTEAVVFGRRAGRRAAAGYVRPEACNWTYSLIVDYLRASYGRWADTELSIHQETNDLWVKHKSELKRTMGLYVGVTRSEAGLKQAKADLWGISKGLDKIPLRTYEDLIRFIEHRMMILTSGLIIDAALQRTATIGSHYRED